MTQRIVSDTKLFFTREDKKTFDMGEGELFEIYRIDGLALGDVENESVPNALQNGELYLGSRVINRIIDIESYWGTMDMRRRFTDYFQPGYMYELRILFNGSNYYTRCVLKEAYKMEEHRGSLYSGSSIDLSLFCPDPSLFTDNTYRYAIGYSSIANFLFYDSDPTHWPIVFPQQPGLVFTFSEISEPQEYSINNPNTTQNGIEARITCTAPVVKPRITNITTGVFTELEITMTPGDEVYMNTQSGLIEFTQNGLNVRKFLSMNSRMVQVIAGENTLLFSAETGAQTASCEISFRGRVLAL